MAQGRRRRAGGRLPAPLDGERVLTLMEPTRLDLGSRVEAGIPVVDVSGEIDVYTVPRFKEQLSELLDGGHKHLVVNLEKVLYMDSSGFGALLGATKRLRPEGGSLALVGCNQVISRMLKITRLNTIFQMYDTEADALQAFNTQSPPDDKAV
jgi:anti-sigma B factor antagonist